jgi:hypothetical protein
MALGNSMSMGQARGKNKPIKIKRRVEEMTAKDYTAFQGSAVQGSAACSVSNGNVNVTYYHTQASVPFPMLSGTYVYTKRRANSRYYAADGHMKIGPDRGRYYNIEILSGKLRANAVPCP